MTSIAPDDISTRHSKKIHEIDDGILLHWCNGCRCLHPIHTKRTNLSGAKWSFNGNYESPTFVPSVNIVGRCHYFITDGKIIYCSDSNHTLSGQTVDLPDIPDDMAW